jgi:NAD+ diphosphatase
VNLLELMMDNFTRSSHNMFVAQVLNRAHNRRKSEGWVRERLDAPDSLFLPIWQSKVLVTDGEAPRPVFLKRHEIGQAMQDDAEALFLGVDDGRDLFAIELRTGHDAPPSPPDGFGSFRDLRAVGPLLSKKDGALLAYAKTLTYWHGRNHFCGACGNPSKVSEGGHVRVCSNPDCGALHFPRTDPAIIVLIRCGEKCLLARQPIWPKLMYSVIAGFVEPGESAEAAVVREAFEEAGVRVKNVFYHSSQPWPFPSSLMLGFTAEAESESLRLGDKELEDARWFSRQELKQSVENGTLRLPSTISIAYHLIEDWFDSESAVPMREIATGNRII